jgi:hypothetical protein
MIGDRVQIVRGDGAFSYADVVFIPHKNNRIQTKFIELSTMETGPIKVSHRHSLQTMVI